ncbi:enoyl-CoA hydratase/isomerase family protein [Bradyrhizobium sp. PRIMUS42]|uniref:enoyl-CoA hydratase/isomerase family protein n=1 Tax=Bradyrhizobium sp. PRIMUS42 TaxID=2908926 RepID=UPI001FF18E2C|nr:enoyl-CoA hydratase-related protein [Bradyrhizobium sp. PRIMUS42]MCJ9728634.1 enoyl-CoA hydratase-related protein [Bradyrhizobium sp. PRIMUS42]
MTDIECTRNGTVATVTINRPDVRNAMKLAMWKNMAATFKQLSVDKSVRAIILTGSGGNFSVGADVSEFEAVRSDTASSKAYEVAVDACSDAIAAAPQPVIAVLSGYCLGGGCHLSMACDFRFAGPSAEIGIPAANFSIVYGVRSTKRLLALVGITNAKRILYTAERMDARSALHVGLVDRVSDDPAGDAQSLAAQISEKTPLSIAGAKHILNAAAMMEPDAEADRLIDHASASEDYREARRAFAEKRKPKFTWS